MSLIDKLENILGQHYGQKVRQQFIQHIMDEEVSHMLFFKFIFDKKSSQD